MGRSKYGYGNIHIGDEILTKDGKTGKVIALKSYSYINDKIIRDNMKPRPLIDMMPFGNDNVKHLDVWYGTVTIAVKDDNLVSPIYYIQCIEFTDIKEIHGVNEELP